MALCGCLSDYSDCPDDIRDDAGDYVLRLSVSAAGNLSTRTGGHGLVQGTDAEDYINILDGDYAVAIYDMDGNFITSVTNTSVPRRQGDIYWVESIINKKYVERIQDDFQVLVVANWKSYDKGNDYNYPTFGNNALTSLWTNATDYNFTYQATVAGGNDCWTPSIEAKRFIPMFGIGIGTFSDATQGIDGNREILLEVPMLRALAKVEVIDNINGADISNVSMTKYNKSGRYIPDISTNVNWATDNIQVVIPSLPSDNTNDIGTDLQFFKDNIEKNIWFAYIPEMSLGTTTTISDDRPHLNVTVQVDEPITYPLHFARYNENGTYEIPNTQSWNYILRNHIYRYTVNSVNVTANLTLNVLPWNLSDDELWDYSDIPGSNKPVTWDACQSEAVETATVTMNISSTPLKGTFTIQSPLSGTWHAYLMAIGDAVTDAITFTDATGAENYGTHQTGPISTSQSGNADEVTIYIKPTVLTAQQESKFKLVIMVENLGRWMEVNLTPNESDATTWTIVRPSNNI